MQKRSQLEEIGNKYKRRGNIVALAVLSVIGLAIYGLVAPVVAKKREMSKHNINGNPNFYRPLSQSNSRVQPHEHDEKSSKIAPRSQ
jgi:hypothetical protein